MNNLIGAAILIHFAKPIAAGNVYITDGDAQDLVYFLFVGLVCGGLISHFLSRYRLDIPYTVVVFFFGCCLLSIANAIGAGVTEPVD